MLKKTKSHAIGMLIFAFTICCNGGEMTQENTGLPSLHDVPASAWERLCQKKIYFGHQSVGLNVIEGIRDLMKENPKIKLSILEISEEADFTTGMFLHSRIGTNRKPQSKMSAFENLMEQSLSEKVDISFFKFCYVDIESETDVGKVFSEYKNTLARMKKEYPETVFIHASVPLTSVQTGPRAWIKKFIGKPVRGHAENIKRHEFNELLRENYICKDSIIDIARIESTHRNGTCSSFKNNGKTYYSLAKEYTYDGGHLNEEGRKLVAEQLLLLLVNLS